MKLSYKIALIVSSAVLLLAVFLLSGSGGSEPDTTQTADDATQAGQTERQSLVNTPAKPGSDDSSNTKNTASSKKPAGSPTTKSSSSLLADIRKYQQKATENTSSDTATEVPADTDTIKQAEAKPADVDTAKANTPEAIALNRTDTEAVKPVVESGPNRTPAVSRSELDAILGGRSSSNESETASAANTSISTSATRAANGFDTTSTPAGGTYIIQPGDTLSSIAEKYYGDESKWEVIGKANPLVDPVRLRVGQELRIPALSQVVVDETEPKATKPGSMDVHEVQAGESLSSLADKYYSDPTLWRVIYNFNRDLIGDNPNAIKAGMELQIPPRVSGVR